MQIESTLASIGEAVFTAGDANTARIRFIQHIEGSRVKQADKDKMIAVVKELTSLAAIQRYTANALLKYEGLGVGKNISTNCCLPENEEVSLGHN